MKEPFDENSRVKIPALLHFTRLGYHYRSLKDIRTSLDIETNINIDVFGASVMTLNRDVFRDSPITPDELKSIVTAISDALDADDLGREFFKKLQSGVALRGVSVKLIDFENIEENTFEVVTELPCRVDASTEVGSFRPDITVFINGMPLAFCEVKKPNNSKGMRAEYDRMNKRTANEKYRRFLNITQLMVFSNNMEYDDTEAQPVSGAFYATNGHGHLFFSHFREEDEAIYTQLAALDPEVEDFILKDTNLTVLKGQAEFITNCQPTTPTHRMLASLFTKHRLLWLLRYGITYVEKVNDSGIMEISKHIMRYQQFFASHAITRCLNELHDVSYQAYESPGFRLDGDENTELLMAADGKPALRRARGGVIWHTQGSGKTELAYYNVRILTDYYSARGIVAKFYFIVDRLDLMQQAADEFRARGLGVVEISSRKEFNRNIQSATQQGLSGGLVMNVVNIQKFSDESVAQEPDYNVSVQRVYFIDEAHRDYKEDGTFLPRLVRSDRSAVMFALTGTPLIGKVTTKALFGDYVHKYYYNQSIADGYTLRLIREGIKTEYRQRLGAAIDKLSKQVEKGKIKKTDLTSHVNYVGPLVDYIEEDFHNARLMLGDSSIGAMIVADSSEQAQAVCEELRERGNFSAEVVLSTIGESAEELRAKRDAFKRGEVDILVVYNMLLTGFDAPRLKKLYLGRLIKDHSLLQCLTRVNRPYHTQRFGYVVDFADIRKEFDKTNKAYLAELAEELGDAFQQYEGIFKPPEEIESDLMEVQNKLFSYETDNLEVFTQQLTDIESKETLLDLRRSLALAKELYNLAQLFGYDDLAAKLDRDKIRRLYTLCDERITFMNQKEALEHPEDIDVLAALAAQDIQFNFRKVSEKELPLADAFADKRRQTIGEFGRNRDKKDPVFLGLWEELKRILEGHDIQQMTVEEMQAQDKELEALRKKMHELNAFNNGISRKYHDDDRYMRLHKLLTAQDGVFKAQPTLVFDFLSVMKEHIDDTLLHKESVLANPAFFTQSLLRDIKQELKGKVEGLNLAMVKSIGEAITQQYIN